MCAGFVKMAPEISIGQAYKSVWTSLDTFAGNLLPAAFYSVTSHFNAQYQMDCALSIQLTIWCRYFGSLSISSVPVSGCCFPRITLYLFSSSFASFSPSSSLSSSSPSSSSVQQQCNDSAVTLQYSVPLLSSCELVLLQATVHYICGRFKTFGYFVAV